MLGAPLHLQAQSADYVVGPKDVLAITVWNQLELSGQFVVESDGDLTFPLIGRCQVAGLTVDEVEAVLEEKLGDGFFVDPSLSVSVEEYRSQRIFIIGEVRSAGSYPLNGEMTLVEALALAGSTTVDASPEIIITRLAPGATKPGGPVLPEGPDAGETLRVDIDALQRGELEKNVELRNGDTIFVPRAQRVYVFGQVTRPGAYPIRSETTVLQVLSLAGGVSDRGAANRTKIIRKVGDEEQEIDVELSDVVRPGDTIVVPERFF